jgi:predicted DNA-binding transcriptional regulator AlpA
MGIVDNRVTLAHWIEREGFPAGIKLGPNTRVWPQGEVEDWIASRPTEKKRKADSSNGGA